MRNQEKEIMEQLNNENYVFMGTTVSSGRGKFLVTKTGKATEIGKIATTLETLEEARTPLQKKVEGLAKTLGILFGVVCGLIFLTGFFTGKTSFEMFTTAVAIAVAAIPEGMVVSLTMILAIGMQRILRRKALVRKLLAAETLGSVTVIATDKTGTLTGGDLKVVKTDFTDEELAYLASILVNNQADPLEVALWEWTKKQGSRLKTQGSKLKDPEKIFEENLRVFEMPFDPEKKYQVVVTKIKNKKLKIREEDKHVLFMSGAPEVVLSKCKLKDKEKKEWTGKIERWGKEGLRMISVAMAFVEESSEQGYQEYVEKTKDLNWLGLVGFEDPIREGVAQALKTCKGAGIKVKIITGDYKETAVAVWRKLEVEPYKRFNLSRRNFLNGAEIEKMPLEELKNKVKEVDVFARVAPRQKLRIVEALKENGEVVALLGDGVNDAPALKRSDIGIVVGEATDVAKETADMVLLDSNFATIVAAIEEGRGILDNIKKVILYLLSDSFSEIILVLGSLVLGLPLPLTAAQILWINLLTDGFPDLALTVEPKEKELLKRKPIKKETPLLNLEDKLLITLISLTTGIMSLMLFNFFFKRTGLTLARTITFVALGIDSLFYVFSIKSLKKPIFKINLFSNPYLLVSVGLGLILQILPFYQGILRSFLNITPLNSGQWFLILTVSFLVIILIEGVKFVFVKRKWLDL